MSHPLLHAHAYIHTYYSTYMDASNEAFVPQYCDGVAAVPEEEQLVGLQKIR